GAGRLAGGSGPGEPGAGRPRADVRPGVRPDAAQGGRLDAAGVGGTGPPPREGRRAAGGHLGPGRGRAAAETGAEAVAADPRGAPKGTRGTPPAPPGPAAPPPPRAAPA